MKDKDYEQLATKIMMNALEGVKAQIRKAYDKGYEDGKAATPFTDTEEAEKKEYNRGLAEAWDAARKLCQSVKYGGLEEHCSEIFEKTPFEIFDVFDYTATEAIAKIKAYEDKQKQDAEIKVGDEVYSEEDGLTFIVTRIRGTEYEGICTDGACYNGLPDDIVKTGRTFPQIAEVLAELRGAENDE